MPLPTPASTVVRAHVSFNARKQEYRAYVSIQVVRSTGAVYERHVQFFTTWLDATSWLAGWP